MKATGIIRRIDDLGRIVIPKEIRRSLKIEEGDPLEIYTERDGSIIFKPLHKSWEDTVIEWWEENQNRPAIKRSTFTRVGDYTFCVICKPDGTNTAGFAKRNFGDKEDERIGKVAAFARTLGRPIDEIIGWKGK